MTEQKRYLKLAHRLVVDEQFRSRLVMAPREILITELGISRKTYEALVSIVPAVVAGGLFVLASHPPIGAEEMLDPNWGGWGLR